jgi:hypothetical protein
MRQLLFLQAAWLLSKHYRNGEERTAPPMNGTVSEYASDRPFPTFPRQRVPKFPRTHQPHQAVIFLLE